MLCFAVLGKLVLSMKDIFVRVPQWWQVARQISCQREQKPTLCCCLTWIQSVRKSFAVNLGSKQYLLSVHTAVDRDVFLSIDPAEAQHNTGSNSTKRID